jgi:hypothetical protein
MLAQIYDAVLVGDVGVGEARREQRGHLIDGLQNIFHLNEKTKRDKITTRQVRTRKKMWVFLRKLAYAYLSSVPHPA